MILVTKTSDCVCVCVCKPAARGSISWNFYRDAPPVALRMSPIDRWHCLQWRICMIKERRKVHVTLVVLCVSEGSAGTV